MKVGGGRGRGGQMGARTRGWWGGGGGGGGSKGESGRIGAGAKRWKSYCFGETINYLEWKTRE